MRRGQKLTITVFSALLAGTTLADEPWIEQPFTASAESVLAAAQPFEGPPDADILVLYRDTSYEFDATSRTTYRQRLVYRILTFKGAEDWSSIAVDYAPWHQDRPDIRARVITPDGREHRLAESAFSESMAPSDSPDVFADRRILEAPLPAIRLGAVVEEEITVRDHEPFFAAGHAGSHPLRMPAPIVRGHLRLAAPITLPLRYGVRLMPGLKPRQHVSDGRVELHFEYRDLPMVEHAEVGLPSRLPRVPHVAFSTGESWQKLAADYARLVDEKIAATPPESLGTFLERLDSSDSASAVEDGDPGDRNQDGSKVVRILAELHREVRYTGLELGASSVIPAAPHETLERGLGDCKDQATLLVALLRQAGMSAHVALLKAGTGRDVDPRLPGLGHFDHAVVYVPGTPPSSPPMWIDPTDPVSRAGEIPVDDQNRWALVADAATEKLLRTPAANSVDNRTAEHREVFLTDHGPARIVERSVFYGEPERQQRRIAHSGSLESRRQGYREYVEMAYLAQELGTVEEGDPDDLGEPYAMELEILDAGRAMTDLSEAVVAIRQESLLANLPQVVQQGTESRRGPFVFQRPFVTQWRYRIVPPTGFVLRNPPGLVEDRLGPARYSQEVRDEDGTVFVDLKFDTGPRHLDAGQFEAMRAAVQDFLRREPFLLWFDHVGARALGEGHTREAVEHFKRLADLEDQRAVHRIRLAQALLQVGLGSAARQEAERATELAPESPLAWWSLGFVYEHDEVGRRFSRGFAYDEARAAFEKAIELDPENALPRTELAILLEYDDEGQRYTAATDLERAISEYLILRDELGVTHLEGNLVWALFWAERWRELYAATLRRTDDPTSSYLHLVALTILRGPEAAIRESGNLSDTPLERTNLLNSAAKYLVMARQYRPAGELLRGIAVRMSDPAVVRGRAEALLRTRKHEELPLSRSTPQELAKSLLLTLGKTSFDADVVGELFHPEYVKDRGSEDNALESAFQQMRLEQLKATGDLPVEAVLDLALGVLRSKVDGEAPIGYRVRLLNSIDSAKVAFRTYVTPYEGRLVIAAIESDYGQIAKEAWRRIERGDLRGAHRWLEWAHEAVPRVETLDPYGFHPFERYWVPGTGAFQDKMRLGAAILMANQPEAEDALPGLEAALETLTDERERRAVEVALVLAYRRTEDETKLAALSARLLEREPTSTLAFLGRSQYLLSRRRGAELAEVARARLVHLPADPLALRYLAQAASFEGDGDGAIAHLEALRAVYPLDAGDYNLWAWLLLFGDPIPDEALEMAQLGADQSRYRDGPMLHTLATVFAETGRPAEAHRALLQALDLKEDRRLDGEDWYVMARIAEAYGLDDLARRYYRRVDPEENVPFSLGELIRRRLAILGAASAP